MEIRLCGSLRICPTTSSSSTMPLSNCTFGAEKMGEPLTLYLKNCGTALRFLQVHIAKCYPGAPITLTGDPRLMERDGKPTTQTTSALILHGEPIPVSENESPYITMSRRIRNPIAMSSYLFPCWDSGGVWNPTGLLPLSGMST